jgi:hypothetical protein
LSFVVDFTKGNVPTACNIILEAAICVNDNVVIMQIKKRRWS